MIKKSFLEAFKDRYLDLDDQSNINDDLKIISNKKYTKNVVVELVGREKAIDTFKNLRNLQQIVLTNCLINYANDQNTNQELELNLKSNSSIKSLDISFNQIDSWIEIVKIVELFPYLEELIITGNQFEFINLDNLEWQINVFSKIKNLIAGKLKINWSSIELFNKLFINLKYLNVFNNNLNDLKLNDKLSFLNLEYLSLSENSIDWSNVLKLKQLNNLKHLQLDNCCIEKIELDNLDLFINLNQLNLNNNQLTKWSYVSELSKFKNLTDLSIKDNPLFKEQDYDQMFNFIVGILGELKILNKQIITKDKRKEAEIYFLRTNFRDWLNGKLKEWNIEKRFDQLIEIYGKPVDLLNDIQINKFVVINLKYKDKIFKKKLLKSMDLITLKLLIRRLFNLDNQIEFDLWYLNDDNKSLEFQFDQDNKNLDFYPINDNCTIKLEIK